MANHKSAWKRMRQNEVRRARNRSVKSAMKNKIKNVRLAVLEKDREKAVAELNTTVPMIDKCANKGIIHPRTASRKISRLTRLVNTLTR